MESYWLVLAVGLVYEVLAPRTLVFRLLSFALPAIHPAKRLTFVIHDIKRNGCVTMREGRRGVRGQVRGNEVIIRSLIGCGRYKVIHQRRCGTQNRRSAGSMFTVPGTYLHLSNTASQIAP